MAITFPTSLDNFTQPTATDKLNSVSVPHATQHSDLNAAVTALEEKVGINSSAVVTSHDYKLSQITGTEKAVKGSDVWPIGAVFISVVSTNPATLLGFGTWSAFAAGRVLVGLDSGDTDFDTVEETGGAKTHTLTEAQIPAHTHIQDSHNHTQNAHSHQILRERSATTGGATTQIARTADASSTVDTGVNTENSTATNQATTATNQNTGGGEAHNNMPPYLVCYIWKRIS